MKRVIKQCLQDMRNATCYDDWQAAARMHDELTGRDQWKAEDASTLYDYRMIRLRYNELRTAREKNDIEELVFCINEGLHGNLGGIGNPVLYNQCLFGTKQLVSDYLQEVARCLHLICEASSPEFPLVRKLQFFQRTASAYGQTGLMLSGGATLGMFHLGVLKALVEQDLLPNIISGSSAGSIMTGILGTHKDAELLGLLEPERLYVEAFRMLGWRNTVRGHGVLDQGQLELCLERNIPEMTFKEAYDHTGRCINITVSPANPHQDSRLLNALTSPHVLISKASLASCAIPYLYPPVMLWAKNRNGEKVPFAPSRRWVDGSIKDDLPTDRLARLYGVNHAIVSQVNPHIAPFMSRKAKEKSALGYLTDMVVTNTRYNVSQGFAYLTDAVDNQPLALMFDKVHSVVNQEYSGDITVTLPLKLRSFLKVLANPSPEDLQTYILMGERETWPKMECIRNTTLISRTISDCLERLKKQEAQELKAFSSMNLSA